ncbi:SMAD/FHA domain-containing protein [Decorospora gaudefroyi]|uniref:SMAD/FHA domain-containing protein n=1 Tax=Decorospora gaudefroyi TaxID=184978 RepID=A0A6A5KRW4_9PLEO|nr:SMAD/FHA domain-containing protein [Decorospora gaudefroyi]
MARDLSPYSARRLLTQQLAQGITAAPPASNSRNGSPGALSRNGAERAAKEPSLASARQSRSRSRDRKPRDVARDPKLKGSTAEPSAVRRREPSPEPYRKPRETVRERKRDGSRDRRRERSKDRRGDKSRERRWERSGDSKRDRSRDRRRDRSRGKEADRDGRQDRSRNKDTDRDPRKDRSRDRRSRRDREHSKDRRRSRSRSPIPYRSRKPRTRSPSASTSPPPKRRRHARSPSAHKPSKQPLPSQEVSFRGLDDSAQPPSKYGGAPPDKEKPNFKPTGALAKAANRVQGTKISLKYHEPAEARKPPPSQPWRIFVFKGADVLDTIQIWQKSCWLLGRAHEVVDYVLEHPSSSGQHAVIQFRYILKTVEDEFGVKTSRGKVKPYIIDLDSSNGTELNGESIEPSRYFELRDKDLIKFAGSDREYVVMLPPPESN